MSDAICTVYHENLSWPVFPKCSVGDQEVCEPAGRDGEPDEGDAEAWGEDERDGHTDGEVHHVCDEERLHDAEATEHTVGSHLDAHEDEEVTEPLHVACGDFIREGSAVLTEEEGGDLRMQGLDDDEGEHGEADVQQECSAVAFSDTIGFLRAQVL